MGWSTKRAAAVLAVVAMAFTACGGADQGAEPTTADSEESSTDAEGTTPTAEGTTPTEPTDQASEESEASAQGDESFCTDMNSSVAMATSFSDDDLEGRFVQGIGELDDLRTRAPNEISDDVQTLYEAMVLLDGIFADYGYDQDAVPGDEQAELLAETGVGEATARIAEYCGGSTSAAAGALSGAGVGSFTVDGESFDNVDVYRCEPFSFGSQEADPDDLDLVAGFLTGSNAVQVTVSHEGETTYLGVFYSRDGADGLEQFEAGADNSIPGRFEAGPWKVRDAETGEETELGDAPFAISGGRITGGLTGLAQTWPQDGDGTVDVTFDLEIPSEINDCSTR